MDVTGPGGVPRPRLVAMSIGRGRSLKELIEAGEQSFSFEFFPPKDEAGEEQLWSAVRALEPYHPTFVSVTYGAGGSSRGTTVRVTRRIAQETSMLPMAHLTCVGHTRAELEEILDEYAAAGVHHVMALRGDPEGGPRAEWTPTEGGLTYASELVEMGIDWVWVGYEGQRAGYAQMNGPSYEELFNGLRAHGICVMASMIIGFDLPF